MGCCGTRGTLSSRAAKTAQSRSHGSWTRSYTSRRGVAFRRTARTWTSSASGPLRTRAATRTVSRGVSRGR
eukprot:337166-Rhodomonas_salina.1